MEAGLEATEPLPLARWPADAGGAELATLRRIMEAGVPVAPMVVVPPAAEASFYRWNRLPQRLAELFAPVASHDPDEEDVEDLIPLAGRLIDGHVLLDRWVDAFYDALAPLPSRLHVRRPDERGTLALRGRPALLALRATWRADWAYEPVLARLHDSGSVALEERPVLVHAEPSGAATPELAARVRSLVGAVEAEVLADTHGAVTGVAVEPSAARPVGVEPGG